MKKLTELHRLGFSLGIKVVSIYLKRLFRPATEKETAYLTYYTNLIWWKFKHIEETADTFKVATASGETLYARKPPSSDLQVLKQIWLDDEYAGAVQMLKANIKTPTLNIIDAGANVGYSSVYLYTHLAGQFKPSIIAIEPSDANAAMIRKNFELHNIQGYSIEKAGLFNRTCFLRIKTDFRDGKDWSLRVEATDEPTDLRSVELLDLMNKNGWSTIDFLKIDIEGAEQYLFADPAYASSFLSRTKIISVEIHDEYNVRDSIVKALTENNFSFRETGEITIGINRTLIPQ